MRRGSLIGPILLIAIGGVFLANNLRPELPLLELAARYWPFLLILWGVLRLLEIGYWSIRGRPLPAAGISGGEWTLIVFICLAGSLLYAANRYSHRWPQARITMRGIEVFGETYDYPLSAERAAGKAPRILVENLHGSARIAGVESEEIKVSGRTSIRAWEKSDADMVNARCPLEIVSQGNEIVIRTNQEHVSGPQKVTADLEITVPRGATVQGRGRYGDFDVTGIAGDVEIGSDNAGIRLRDIGGSARIDVRRSDIVRAVNVSGAVDLKGRGEDVDLESVEGPVTITGSYSGELTIRNLAKPVHFQSTHTELRVEKVPGQVRMTLGDLSAEGVVGPMLLRTRSRDVRISDFAERLEIDLERGDIELRPGKAAVAPMTVSTRSGNIELALPAAAKFGLRASTQRGEAVNEYGPELRVEGEGRGAVLSGPAGRELTIKLSTDRGSVAVRKVSAPPANPLSTAAPLKVERQ